MRGRPSHVRSTSMTQPALFTSYDGTPAKIRQFDCGLSWTGSNSSPRAFRFGNAPIPCPNYIHIGVVWLQRQRSNLAFVACNVATAQVLVRKLIRARRQDPTGDTGKQKFPHLHLFVYAVTRLNDHISPRPPRASTNQWCHMAWRAQRSRHPHHALLPTRARRYSCGEASMSQGSRIAL